MDGAVVVNESVSRLAYANVQLMPDPTIPSSETGTRHRTAERVAKQTTALVIAISQERETLTLFVDTAPLSARSHPRSARPRQPGAGDTRGLPAPARPAAGPSDRARASRRGHARGRARGRSAGGDVHAASPTRSSATASSWGASGRLIKLQLEELIGELPGEKRALVHDYHAVGGARPRRRWSGSRGSPSRSCWSRSSCCSCSPIRVGSIRSITGSSRVATVSSRSVPRLPGAAVRQDRGRLRRPRRDHGGLRRAASGGRGHRSGRIREIKDGLRRLEENSAPES